VIVTAVRQVLVIGAGGVLTELFVGQREPLATLDGNIHQDRIESP